MQINTKCDSIMQDEKREKELCTRTLRSDNPAERSQQTIWIFTKTDIKYHAESL